MERRTVRRSGLTSPFTTERSSSRVASNRHPGTTVPTGERTNGHDGLVTHDPAEYGDLWAETYDEEHAWNDPSAAVALLSELAGDGRALELGIGSGRLALPLAERGVQVVGVDSSRAMVDRLRAKPGGGAIDVVIGDMAACDLGGPYRLVFIAFNTIFALADQRRQIHCFQSVRRALEPDGRFVVECFVPDLLRFREGNQAVRVLPTSTAGRLRLDASLHFPDQQRIDTHVVAIDRGHVDMLPITLRYIWPSELDLMAQLADLELESRFGGWSGEAFTPASTSHVSVYRPSGED